MRVEKAQATAGVVGLSHAATMPHHSNSSAATCLETGEFDWMRRAGVLTVNGASIMMMRKIAIGLAAAVIATGAATLGASAYQGGGGHYGSMGHYGGGYKGGMSKGGMYRPSHYGFRQYGEYRHGPRYGYRPYYSGGYGYGGSCWRSVWTPDGWQRRYVCGERPYYRYGGYYRHGGGYRPGGHWYGRR